eukprot:CAMPEP_0177292136 /NCGR_PEP_ID=MMETSP0367-20130122/76618_1 /TAXON_ID=447022 ORGANISM="Scrippsiella hangoei-like, Strain SHHI-4" /NCGR_SAMPLE_ID=MMETSP0367 /ASSEMBLY_ACC=CAM_ASM_000362 /LENGTH=402 /DNA_ID=CAMNT_0018749675 /DNA_START=115 /DNA_END=1323 /DNA_ORIENTATION=+
MPIYEEKLISPLAIRFTQEHIKTLFRDCRIVEDTVEEIKTSAGDGGYDAILEAPFPDIEIIRFSGGAAERHWFTLDNRRLYCLQRAAAKLWPLRVAVKVQILYADPGAVRRKGSSVTVSPSCKVAPLFRWDWKVSVECEDVLRGREAWACLLADDQKDFVDLLAEIPGSGGGPSDILARALMALQAGEVTTTAAAAPKATAKATAGSRTPSTASASERSSAASGEERSPRRRKEGTASPCSSSSPPTIFSSSSRRASVCGGGLAAEALQEIARQLRAPVHKHPEQFTVARGRGGHFTVFPAGALLDADASAFAPATAAAHKARTGSGKGGGRQESAWAEEAIAEVEAILAALGGEGCTLIQDWNSKYLRHLGHLWDFLMSRPDKFRIIPNGRGFRVATVVRL